MGIMTRSRIKSLLKSIKTKKNKSLPNKSSSKQMIDKKPSMTKTKPA